MLTRICFVALSALWISPALAQVKPGLPHKPPAEAYNTTREITIRVDDAQFSPTNVAVPAGSQVRIVLVNLGKRTHSITVELPRRARVVTSALPGRKSSVVFRAPSTPARLLFYDPSEANIKGAINVIAIAASENRNSQTSHVGRFVIGIRPGTVNTIRVAAGQAFAVTLVNKTGGVLTISFNSNPQAGMPDRTLPAGQTQTFTYDAPYQKGTYLLRAMNSGRVVATVKVIAI